MRAVLKFYVVGWGHVTNLDLDHVCDYVPAVYVQSDEGTHDVPHKGGQFTTNQTGQVVQVLNNMNKITGLNLI